MATQSTQNSELRQNGIDVIRLPIDRGSDSEYPIIEFYLHADGLDLLDLWIFSRGLHRAFNYAIRISDDTNEPLIRTLKIRNPVFSAPIISLQIEHMEHGSLKGRLAAAATAALLGMTPAKLPPLPPKIPSRIVTVIEIAAGDLLAELLLKLDSPKPDVKKRPRAAGNEHLKNHARNSEGKSKVCKAGVHEMTDLVKQLDSRDRDWSLELTCGKNKISITSNKK